MKGVALSILILLISATPASADVKLSFDPRLFQISAFHVSLKAKRVMLASGNTTASVTVGYVACQGDAIALSKLDAEPPPISLGIGACPAPLSKRVDFSRWLVPNPFGDDPDAAQARVVRDTLKAMLSDCFNDSCPDLWPDATPTK
jgi:hypothetical protein